MATIKSRNRFPQRVGRDVARAARSVMVQKALLMLKPATVNQDKAKRCPCRAFDTAWKEVGGESRR